MTAFPTRLQMGATAVILLSLALLAGFVPSLATGGDPVRGVGADDGGVPGRGGPPAHPMEAHASGRAMDIPAGGPHAPGSPVEAEEEKGGAHGQEGAVKVGISVSGRSEARADAMHASGG